MSSMRIDGVDNKLLAEMVSNSLSQCFASSRTILHANNDSRVMGARDALERVVALTGTKPNSFGLLKRHNTSGIAGGPNVRCKSSANQCSSLQGVSEFGELATTDYYCMSDTDDLSTEFNLMDAALNELEEDGVEVEKVLAEIDEGSVLSIATNFKGATSIRSRKKAVKEQEKCVVHSHKGRKRAHSVQDGVIMLPNAFHSRWLSPQENSLMFTTPEEKNIFGRGKSRENNHRCFSTLYTPYKEKCYLDVQEKGTWSRLCVYMTRSCSTQSALHDWDRMNGLPASHARSMIKTGRSRKMLQNWLQSFVQHP